MNRKTLTIALSMTAVSLAAVVAVPAVSASAGSQYLIVDAQCPVYWDNVEMVTEADRQRVDEARAQPDGLSEMFIAVNGQPTLVFFTPIHDPTIPQPTAEQTKWAQDPTSGQYGSDPRTWHQLCWPDA